MSKEAIFDDEYSVDENGQDYGLTKADLVRSVEVWFHTQDGEVELDAAAQVFNVNADWLGIQIAMQNNPYFFISEADDCTRFLDCDGA